MLCEFAGTLSIFLYIRMHQSEWKAEYERRQFDLNVDSSGVGTPGAVEGAIVGGLGIGGYGGVYRRPSAAYAASGGSGQVPAVTLQPPTFDIPPEVVPIIPVFCRKHGRGRRYSRTRDFPASRESSPIPMLGYGMGLLKASPRNSLTVPSMDPTETGLTVSAAHSETQLPPRLGQPMDTRLSESMRDLTYFTLPSSRSNDQGMIKYCWLTTFDLKLYVFFRSLFTRHNL